MQPSSRPLSAAVMGYGTVPSSPEDIKKETFWSMLTLVFCPLFTIASFIFWVSLVDIFLYIPLVAVDFDSHQFLAPTSQGLNWLGAKNGYSMQQEWQLWRWVTPLFLHANLVHLIYNVLMQMIIGFRLEPAVGWIVTAIIYILSGIGGVLFSALVSPDSLSVGASTAIFGITSALVALIIFAWNDLPGGPGKVMTLIWVMMLLVFNLVAGVGAEHVDVWGHIGGLIVGFLLGGMLFTQIKWLQRAFTAGLVVYFVGGFVLFYTVIDTSELEF